MTEARPMTMYKLIHCMMPKYAGYKCKELERGKFTLSFR